MKKSTLFQRLLLLLLAACFLTAALSGVIYSKTGIRMLAEQIAEEMRPRAENISRIATRYLSGQIPFDIFMDFTVREQRDSDIFIFDQEGRLLICTEGANSDAVLDELHQHVSVVLETNFTVISTAWRAQAGIVVAVPIFNEIGFVSGVAIISRPHTIVRASVKSLMATLVMSSIAAVLLLLLPVLYASRRISKPIREMTELAAQMSHKNFSKRASITGYQELRQLGEALNRLSDELSISIEELIRSREYLNTILYTLNEGVLTVTKAHDISFHNPATVRLLDCEDTGQGIRKALGACFDIADTARISGERQEKTLRIGDTVLLASAVPVGVHRDETSGDVVFLLQDISEYERLEQTRRDYVANVSHELRTPIASIRGLAEALSDGMVRDDEAKARYYGYILRESLRLSRLINDLLELSRLQSSTDALVKDIFSLDELLIGVAERMQDRAADCSLSLVYERQALPQVYSNRDRIEQVTLSLVDNALKYAVDDGVIRILTCVEADQILVQVRNTGSIANCHLPHIFERFYKADKSHSKSGTGLGLAIAKEVMTLLGERITAYNEADEVVFSYTVKRA